MGNWKEIPRVPTAHGGLLILETVQNRDKPLRTEGEKFAAFREIGDSAKKQTGQRPENQVLIFYRLLCRDFGLREERK